MNIWPKVFAGYPWLVREETQSEKMPGSFITSSTLRRCADYGSQYIYWMEQGGRDKSQKAENSPFYYGSGKKKILPGLSIVNTKSK